MWKTNLCPGTGRGEGPRDSEILRASVIEQLVIDQVQGVQRTLAPAEDNWAIGPHNTPLGRSLF